MVGKPLVLDIALKGLPSARGIAGTAGGHFRLGSLPGFVGLAFVGEHARRTLAPTLVAVAREVPNLAVVADSLLQPTHAHLQDQKVGTEWANLTALGGFRRTSANLDLMATCALTCTLIDPLRTCQEARKDDLAVDTEEVT